MNERHLRYCNYCAVKDERIAELQNELYVASEGAQIELEHVHKDYTYRMLNLRDDLQAAVETGNDRVVMLVVKGILAEMEAE